MDNDTIIKFAKPTDFSSDPLVPKVADLLREGARELLADAVSAEVSDFLANQNHHLAPSGR